ncbi:exonuclease domain-containing protein [Belnapia rosea]|uniref:exonuclease domain-containing protein n=1 Tax=Belnapia rosea TaxID=938405 RepID=UPI00087E0EB6|nr:exonuclease domain-containing protein [Belnapia rosea]SDB75010.1 DNA polymerase III, epsilon subunit [Belnapia rosea]
MTTTLLFLDIETSGLDSGSFPIEIAWCDVDGHGEAHLIRPTSGWTAWNTESEAMHGIARERLLAEGKPATAVARRAASALSSKRVLVLSDAPAFDQVWLDRLFAAGGNSRPVQLHSLWRVLRGSVTGMLRDVGAPGAALPDLLQYILEEAQRADAARGPIPHRALPDAQRNAAVWRHALSQTEELAERWRAAHVGGVREGRR